MSEIVTVRALLKIEDASPDILFERAPGSRAFLWPLMRWPLAAAISAQNLNVKAVPGKVNQDLRLRISRRLPNRHSSDRLDTNVEHLFIVSGTTLDRKFGKSENWLCDAFAEPLGGAAAVVQDSPFHALTPRNERPKNPRTWSFEPAALRVLQHTQLTPYPAASLSQLKHILDQILEPFNGLLNETWRQKVINEVTYRVVRLRPAEAEFSKLLDRTEPRRIYMQTAAYGDRSNFIRIAHERNIEVIELQHGWIGASHAAYNFGRAMMNTELTSSLPDTLFTFGEYWGQDLRFPGRVVAIGKPSLERTAREAAPYAERPNRLLLISSIYEVDLLTAVALRLKERLPSSWEIALRPHPSERASAPELFAEAIRSGIELDQESDVGASIVRSRAVVGLVSTVLYEALPLAVHIGVIDTELSTHYSNSSVFPRRLNDESSIIDFAELAVSGEEPGDGVTRSFWHPDPVESFLAECRQSKRQTEEEAS